MIRLTFETSGTTGEPKGITHSLDAMIANAEAFNKAVGLNSSTRMYHCLPKTHMSGFLNTILCPTLAGGRVVFGPTFSAQTAAGFWPGIIDARANAVWITPTIAAMLLRINRLARKETYQYGDHLDHVFCGTAPLPRSIRDQWLHTHNIPLQESYGTSEQMLVSVQDYDDAENGEHSAGVLLPGMSVEISAESEILVNGSPTGDQGEYKDNRLTITGRIKDLIKRGGVAISPVRIEEYLRKMDGVSDVAVIGQPDEFWGEKIVAFIETTAAYPVGIQDYCRDRLPKSHMPDVFRLVDKLPRNAMGKVIKGELKSRLAV